MSERVEDVQLYIDGTFIHAHSRKTFSNLNPFTNQELNRVAEGDETDIGAAVTAASSAFHDDPWGRMKVQERMTYLRRIADLTEKHREDIALLESVDTGLLIEERIWAT